MNHNKTPAPAQRVRPSASGGLQPAARAPAVPCRRTMQGLACGLMLQASGCTFDAETFLNDSLTAVYNNVATTFIITALADLLNVAPTFGF